MHMKFAEFQCYVWGHDTKAKCYFLFSLISLHIIIHHLTILIICLTNVLKNNSTCLISVFNHELQLLKIEKQEQKTSKLGRSPIIFFLAYCYRHIYKVLSVKKESVHLLIHCKSIISLCKLSILFVRLSV